MREVEDPAHALGLPGIVEQEPGAVLDAEVEATGPAGQAGELDSQLGLRPPVGPVDPDGHVRRRPGAPRDSGEERDGEKA